MLAAPDGVTGLNIVQAAQPDFIVLDVEMPGMNGYMFLMELKRINKGMTIPVIVATSHEENKMIFYRHGIKDYLVKPINPEELLTKIQAIIGQA